MQNCKMQNCWDISLMLMLQKWGVLVDTQNSKMLNAKLLYAKLLDTKLLTAKLLNAKL